MNDKKLKEKIKKLEIEIKKLRDENSSLWFMLDEIDKSNIYNYEHRKKFEEVFNKLQKQTIMTHPKVEEA